MNSQKIEELEATIAKAQQQIEELKRPKLERFNPSHDNYYIVNTTGSIHSTFHQDALFDKARYDFFNCYEAAGLAKKAIPLMRRSNAIIMAKLLVDPDFKPDWSDEDQKKYSVFYNHATNDWDTDWSWAGSPSPAHVSTIEKAEQMGELLTEWGVV